MRGRYKTALGRHFSCACRCRGGNAANTAAVAADLSSNRLCVRFSGCIVDPGVCDGAAFVLSDLRSHAVLPTVHTLPAGSTPTSYILRSANSGSRTIVHHRDIQELSHACFMDSVAPALGLHRHAPLHCLHAEGRQAPDTARIMQWHLHQGAPLTSPNPSFQGSRRAAVQATGRPLKLLSVEIEKTRAQHGAAATELDDCSSELSLLPLAHIVFSCREYASQVAGGHPAALCLLLLQASMQPLHAAHASKEYGAAHVLACLPEVAVTWGEEGAYAFIPAAAPSDSPSQDGDQVLLWGVMGQADTLYWADTTHSAEGGLVAGTLRRIPTPRVPRVVDTVGAGDSFIAGVLAAVCMSDNASLDFVSAVQSGVRVASAKVAQEGMGGLSLPGLTASAAPAGP